ncbi:MAG: tetratricopeptide repeat protein, partial [Archangium sp.]
MAYKDEQKDLKQPDELQKLGQEAVPFMEKHGKVIVGGVGAVLAVGFIIAIVTTLNVRGDEQASRDFGAALAVLDREVNATPPADLPAGKEAPFKTEAEKDEAIIKSLTDFRAK